MAAVLGPGPEVTHRFRSVAASSIDHEERNGASGGEGVSELRGPARSARRYAGAAQAPLRTMRWWKSSVWWIRTALRQPLVGVRQQLTRPPHALRIWLASDELDRMCLQRDPHLIELAERVRRGDANVALRPRGSNPLLRSRWTVSRSGPWLIPSALTARLLKACSGHLKGQDKCSAAPRSAPRLRLVATRSNHPIVPAGSEQLPRAGALLSPRQATPGRARAWAGPTGHSLPSGTPQDVLRSGSRRAPHSIPPSRPGSARPLPAGDDTQVAGGWELSRQLASAQDRCFKLVSAK